jgi:ankyrin repeat protein
MKNVFDLLFQREHLSATEMNYLKQHQDEIVNFTLGSDISDIREIFLSSLKMGLSHIVITLIKKSPKFIELKVLDDSTPLIVAANYRHFTLVNQLIDLGANLDAVNKNKHNGLHYLCVFTPRSELEKKQMNLVTKKIMSFQNINQKNKDGNISLTFAVATKKVEVVEEQLKYNVQFNYKNDDGMSTLEIAANQMLNYYSEVSTYKGEISLENPACRIFEAISKGNNNSYQEPQVIILGWLEDFQ